jgi:thiol-disulfide isomerase/thioredoxin
MEGMDAMRRSLRGLITLGGSLPFAVGVLAAAPPPPRAAVPPQAFTAPVVADDHDLQSMLDRVTALSDLINRDSNSPKAWSYLLEQADLLKQLAMRSPPGEAEKLLMMAIDSYQGAAVRSPDNETTAARRLQQMPGQLTRSFPGNSLITYAAMQAIQADYLHALAKEPEHLAEAQNLLRTHLVQFAIDYAGTPESSKAMLQVAELSESLGKLDDARRFYHYLVEAFPGQAVAHKAGGSLWRMGLDGEPLHFQLPELYAASDRGQQVFDLQELRGKLVVVYFWSSDSPKVAEDFEALKQLTVRYHLHGLETVYVNMDDDSAKAKTFLTGRLTAGVHVYQRGGLDGAIAERYGIQSVPQIFLVGKDGTLLKHSLQTSQLDTEVSARLTHQR